ncbi:hypothetical protein CUJ83_14995 [Methanocella sp. CWC-04]|uniref:Uncharacterized protein n=1 Tax=Methanooceanicella nereidis TaxID=2052831 RepID=A0AAP2W7D5_9EURY|nr:hypothetical protein [Methanocella sp. CWC-04]MCD1296308.1 hypothetical protein [Methanocella sp. CWC-04]
MSKVKRSVVLALIGLFMIALSMPACAWVGPSYLGPYLGGAVNQAIPYSAIGTGFSETKILTGGSGAITSGDSFYSGAFGPFGYPCSPCGGIGGLAQSGVGGNVVAQDYGESSVITSTAFGLRPLNSLVFGIPVPGPGGVYFC